MSTTNLNSATVSTTHVRTIKNSTILIVEDEKEIRRFVRLALEGENWQVFECDTLKRGLIETATRKPDLLILDLGLPDGNGIDLIEDIRQWSDIPIIVLSARDSEQDKVTALDCGADDYLSKPFGINELIARVRVALRRSSKANQLDPVIHFSDIQVDLVNRRVLKGQNELHLTPIEYRLLTELLTNSGKVLTQRHLLNHVWGPNFVEHNHYLRIYMGHLRQKLEADPARPKHLLTETGIGYRFMP
ncbi:DNA-binding response regulator in two-component regulatory system [Xenorhabdus sp. PB62.4]|nr:DNA-binding response regulator in two-component regulatory system [Xenorhabdus sp. PB62.4]